MANAIQPHFAVDREGLRKILAKRGKALAVFELVSNAWDEDVSRVDVTLEWLGRGKVRLAVEDDDPEGFTDLSHAYTLFAESEKKAHAEKRGRFNLGEKFVVAICDEAYVQTTTGTIRFNKQGRVHEKTKRERGSIFVGVLAMGHDEYDEVVLAVERLIPPPEIETFFNGKALTPREPVKVFEEILPTEIADDEGRMKRTFRKTRVALYEPTPDEKASIYEMGIPVVDTGDRWHVDVQQKVPLNVDRDNVTPAYLRELRRVVLDHSTDILDEDTAQQTWVTNALEDPKISEEAVKTAIKQRFGDKVVRYDVRDTEANKLATSEGYVVLSSRALPKAANDALKRFDAVKPAGQVTPSPKPYQPGQGSTRQTLPPAEWSEGMERTVAFAQMLGHELLDAEVAVEIVNDRDAMNFTATYAGGGSKGHLEFNMRTLGRKWFDGNPVRAAVIDLVIHEFGHHFSRDHLDRSYLNALTKLAGQVAMLALRKPEVFYEHDLGETVALPKAAR